MKAVGQPATAGPWARPQELTSYITCTHHHDLRLTLRQLNGLADRIALKRLVPLHLMDQFRRQLLATDELLKVHLHMQERRLFPRILQLTWTHAQPGRTDQDENLEESVNHMARKNQEAVAMLVQLEASLLDRGWIGKGDLVDELIESTVRLREHMGDHVHLETDVLFPWVRELVRRCPSMRTA